MTSSLPRYVALATLLALASSHASELPIHASMLSGSGDPAHAAHDGRAATSLTVQAGQPVSFMLAEEMEVQAIALAGKAAASEGYILLSDNYRDWRLVYEGALPGNEILRLDLAVPITARYLRVIPNEPIVIAEITAGSTTDVTNAAESWVPHNWGDVTQPAVIETLLDRAFEFQSGQLWDQTGWISGAFHTGVMATYELTGEQKYLDYVVDVAQEHSWKLKTRSGQWGLYHADDHVFAQSLLEIHLFADDPQPLWIQDVRNRFDGILANPLPGREDYWWCDALFMAPPAWMRLYAITGNVAYLNFINEQWWDSTDFLYDTAEKLYYRDSNFFDSIEESGQKVFWSRGNGWVMAGIVRMLQYMPEDFADRPRYVELLEDMAERVAGLQQPDGLWTSSLLYPEKYLGEPETSGSAFFVYAMAWGVNNGILAEETYGPVVEAGWSGLAWHLKEDGFLDFIQQVGSAPDLYDGAATRKDYGYGAFLMAGTEMHRYFTQKMSRSGIHSLSAGIPNEQRLYIEATAQTGNWTLLGNFEAGSTGWTLQQSKTAGFHQVLDDPFDPVQNSVLKVSPGEDSSNHARAYVPVPANSPGATSTLYLRIAFEDPVIDVAWGLTDVAAPSGFMDFEASMRIYENGHMEQRSGTNYTRVTDDFLELRTWHEVWIVANNQTDRFNIYMRGGSKRREIVQLGTEGRFRNGTSSPLQTFLLIINGASGPASVYLDDIWYSEGEHLGTPPDVLKQEISLFSDDWIYGSTDQVRWTFTGWLEDSAYPWVYNFNNGGWWWVQTPEGAQTDFYGWHSSRNTWFWTDGEHGGWYFPYDTAEWDFFEHQ